MKPTESNSSFAQRRLWSRIWRATLAFLQEFSRSLLSPFRWVARASRIERLNRGQLAWAALVLFVVFTVLAYRQFRRPYHWHEPYTRFSYSWWKNPAEWNPDAALPAVT